MSSSSSIPIDLIITICFLAFVAYIHLSSKNLMKKLDDEKDYFQYLKFNDCKRYEDVLIKEEGINEEDLTSRIDSAMNAELNICNEYIKNNPKNLFARERRADIYSSLKNYQEAIYDYKYLMRKEPKNFYFVIYCAIVYAESNDLNTALALINNFYKNKKNDSEYYYALGCVFYKSKKHQLAIKNYSEAIKLKPHWIYYSGRADVYKEIGETDKYQADYNKYRKLLDDSMSENNTK